MAYDGPILSGQVFKNRSGKRVRVAGASSGQVKVQTRNGERGRFSKEPTGQIDEQTLRTRWTPVS